MNCPNCGAFNQDGMSTCASCGAALTQQPYGFQPQQPYSYQPQQPYGYAPVPVQDPAKGLAIASLVCGILSLIFFAIILGPLGCILGGVAKSKGSKSGMATGGIVCGVIGIVSWVLLMALGASIGLRLF